MMPTRWLREPLLHFLLIGVLLFVVYGRIAPADKSGERIVITQALADDLARQHQARWMRPASERELAGLLEAYVRDEIQYREGVALGLDRDDPVIKRRVRQKVDLISEEQRAVAAPSEAELSDYLARNADRFTRPATSSFEQIFFDGSASVPVVERAVAAARAALARGADPTRLGQATMLPHTVHAAPVDRIARDFREAFVESLSIAPLNAWVGPVGSGLGAHLVRVTARTSAAPPALYEVRQQVVREWENERRERSRAESYRQLRGHYDVVIEATLPQPATPQP